MAAKTKAERLAESRERTNWLAIEVALDELRQAVKARAKDLASLRYEAIEPLIAELRGEDGQATDVD